MGDNIAKNMLLKTYKKVIFFIFVSILLFGFFIPRYEFVHGETNELYEYGIKLTENNSIVTNRIFKDIRIGIAVFSSNNVIENCVFINCSDEGVVLLRHGTNNTIRNCRFVDCCDGIEIQNTFNHIHNCKFIDNYHAGIDILSLNSKNYISNCEFTGCNTFEIYRR